MVGWWVGGPVAAGRCPSSSYINCYYLGLYMMTSFAGKSHGGECGPTPNEAAEIIEL